MKMAGQLTQTISLQFNHWWRSTFEAGLVRYSCDKELVWILAFWYVRWSPKTQVDKKKRK